MPVPLRGHYQHRYGAFFHHKMPPENAILHLTLKEWTITAWVKQEQTPEWSVVLVKDPANGLQNYALDMNKEGRVFSEITCEAK